MSETTSAGWRRSRTWASACATGFVPAKVVGEAVLDRARVVAAPDRRRRHPVGTVARALLLVEMAAVDAVGVALQRQGAAAQVRQHGGRDPRVVVDHLTLREPGLGIEDL